VSERATVRPVTLARLVEVTYACETVPSTTDDVESALEASHRRARETILEATRIGLISEDNSSDDEEDSMYEITPVGSEFLEAVRDEKWRNVSSILQTRSPHFGALLELVSELEPVEPETALERLQEEHEHSPYDFNQTSIEVVGDWGERLGSIQRNAFTGSYYRATETDAPPNFPYILLTVFEELEDTAGVNLSQRYISIPELREYVCERLACTRSAFDEALLSLVNQNVGKIELSGAPVDTGAKEAQLGIKQIELDESDGLVSTAQSTEAVMSGVEQYDKQYYYLAVHDDDLSYTPENQR